MLCDRSFAPFGDVVALVSAVLTASGVSSTYLPEAFFTFASGSFFWSANACSTYVTPPLVCCAAALTPALCGLPTPTGQSTCLPGVRLKPLAAAARYDENTDVVPESSDRVKI